MLSIVCLDVALCSVASAFCQLCCSAAGTQTGSTSNADSNTRWYGNITLANGKYNVTVDYHNGNGDGYLLIRAGYNTASDSNFVSSG